MALPWLALIKAVPWTEVVGHAPTVLNAAKKLWKPKAGQPGQSGPPIGTGTPLPVSADARAAALEAQLAELRGRLSDTNLLVQDMAEQQARMLVQIDDNRKALSRMRWVAAVALVLAGVAAFKAFGG